MKISRLTDLVAIRLGSSPCRRASAGEAASDLESMVRAAAPGLAARLTLEAADGSGPPPASTVDFRDYLKANLKAESGGIHSLAMPADFLALHSLRMKGWPATVIRQNRLSGVNPLRQALGPAAPAWMAVRPTLPWLECETHLDPDSGTSGTLIRLCPVETPQAESALYVPRPCLDEASDTLTHLDASLIEPLIERLYDIFNNI